MADNSYQTSRFKVGVVFFQFRTIHREVGTPPETFANREVGGRDYRDVLVACLRRSSHLPVNPKQYLSSSVPNERSEVGNTH